MKLANLPVRTRLIIACAMATAIVIFVISGGMMMRLWGIPQTDPPSTDSAQASERTSLSESEQRSLTEPERKSLAEKAEQRGQESRFAEARRYMVEKDLRGRDITNQKVLEAMGRVPRHRFVPDELAASAYADHPLPIGHNQTISQPYIVALMTQLADPRPESRALDIGTGSGYQAAVLAEICKEVYSIEIIKPLADEARQRLKELGYKNITVRHGDGYRGWPEKAPFDVIIVAAAPDHIPQPLVDQLAPGGKMVLPVGRFYQELVVVEKQPDGTIRRKPNIPVMFVPMTGEAQKRQ